MKTAQSLLWTRLDQPSVLCKFLLSQVGSAITFGQMSFTEEPILNPDGTLEYPQVLNISDSVFENNTAARCGGALWTSNTVLISNTLFHGNSIIVSSCALIVDILNFYEDDCNPFT